MISVPVSAQLVGTDTAPGSSCAGFPDGATRVTADADLDGSEVVLVCDGSTWQPTSGGLPNCPQGSILVKGSVIWECQCFTGEIGWTDIEPGGGARDFIAIAPSDDGTILATVDNGGRIYTSIDGGSNWNSRDSNRDWIDIDVSSDGSVMAAVVDNGRIYTSTNTGVSWTARDSNRDWSHIAMSSDGSTMIASVEGSSGDIYVSTNTGVSWTAQTTPSSDWTGVGISSDGSVMAAVADSSSRGIYVSTNGGTTWNEIAGTTGLGFVDIAMSADGTYMVAAYESSSGKLYVSSNTGSTWTPYGPDEFWGSVAVSANGQTMVAAPDKTGSSLGEVYRSRDFGVSWNALGSTTAYWDDVDLVADGTDLFRADEGSTDRLDRYDSSCSP